MDVKGPYKQKSRAMEDKDIIVKIYGTWFIINNITGGDFNA